MSSVYVELALVSLAAAVSPTTVTFSVLSVVLSKRPLRTGVWFYLGAFLVTIAIGVAAAFVLGDVAASSRTATGRHGSRSSTWSRRSSCSSMSPAPGGGRLGEKTTKGMVDKMSAVASSPWIAVFAAGATLANPGAFIPFALKTISEIRPTTTGYAVLWLVFTVCSLLPLASRSCCCWSCQSAEQLLRARLARGHLRLDSSVIIPAAPSGRLLAQRRRRLTLDVDLAFAATPARRLDASARMIRIFAASSFSDRRTTSRSSAIRMIIVGRVRSGPHSRRASAGNEAEGVGSQHRCTWWPW